MRISDFLPNGIGTEQFIILAAAAASFIAVIAVWNALVVRDPMRSRARQLISKRQEMRAGMMGPQRRSKPEQSIGFMRAVIQKLNLLKSRQVDGVSLKLSKAGWRNKDALVIYLFFKVLLPLIFGGVAVAGLILADTSEMPPMVRILIATCAVVAGAFTPDFVIRRQTSKRQKALQKALPDGLDLLVICTEAGLGLDAALNRVAGEMAAAFPELADELTLTAIELGFLPDRKKALENLVERTGLASIRGVVNTLVQTEKYGTPLASSLRVLAAEFREDRMLRAEEKAAKLPATLTVPMIIFILPTLFIVLIGPAAIQAIDGLKGLSIFNAG